MESISVFDIIKIGIGPSSSHTMGPWEAALHFCHELKAVGLDSIDRVHCSLYGSLAKTGKGHGTDFAVTLGLAGYSYKTANTQELENEYQRILKEKILRLAGKKLISFENLIEFFPFITLEEHPNGMTLEAYSSEKCIWKLPFHFQLITQISRLTV